MACSSAGQPVGIGALKHVVWCDVVVRGVCGIAGMGKWLSKGNTKRRGDGKLCALVKTWVGQVCPPR